MPVLYANGKHYYLDDDGQKTVAGQKNMSLEELAATIGLQREQGKSRS